MRNQEYKRKIELISYSIHSTNEEPFNIISKSSIAIIQYFYFLVITYLFHYFGPTHFLKLKKSSTSTFPNVESTTEIV